MKRPQSRSVPSGPRRRFSTLRWEGEGGATSLRCRFRPTARLETSARTDNSYPAPLRGRT